MKRVFFVALGAILSLNALASYELALIADESDGSIRRYDPITNKDLGSIGKGYLPTVAALATDPTNPNAIAALSYASVKWFNYSTGEMLKGFSVDSWYSNTPPEMEIMTNGNVLLTSHLSGGATTKLYSPTGTLLSTLSYPSGHSPVSTGLGSDNMIYAVTKNGSNFYWTRFSSSGGSYLSYSFIYSSGEAGDFESLLVKGNKFYKVASGVGNAGPNFRYGNLTVLSISFGTYGGGSYFSYPAFSGLAEAHGNVYWIESDGNTGSQRIYRWDPYDNYYYNTNQLPYDGYLRDMVIISAPEPSTLMAGIFGVGAVLLRRRTKKRN